MNFSKKTYLPGRKGTGQYVAILPNKRRTPNKAYKYSSTLQY